MNIAIIYAIISLSVIGVLSAVILYFVAQKFKVIEDPRIDEVAALLPGVNCGGCGFAGCRNMAENIVGKESTEGFFCPPGGNETMKTVAAFFGQVVEEKEPLIAVLRCNGTKSHAVAKTEYDGLNSCFFIHNLYSGSNGCAFGCLGGGDCVDSCKFDAMYMDKETGLPVILQDKCVACGACVKTCPRKIIELRLKGLNDNRVFVCCINTEKGGVAKKNCEVACIGCGRCVKVCESNAITLENNLAYIDFEKCTLSRKCVKVCPTNAIWEVNFPEEKIESPLKQWQEDNFDKL